MQSQVESANDQSARYRATLAQLEKNIEDASKRVAADAGTDDFMDVDGMPVTKKVQVRTSRR